MAMHIVGQYIVIGAVVTKGRHCGLERRSRGNGLATGSERSDAQRNNFVIESMARVPCDLHGNVEHIETRYTRSQV